MCDGELILENSPLHQYLQEIGWDDTQTITRTAAPQDDPAQTAPTTNTLQLILSNSKSLAGTVVCRVCSYVLLMYSALSTQSDLNLSDLREEIEPHLLAHHRDSLEDLTNSGVISNIPPRDPPGIPISFVSTIFYLVVVTSVLLVGIVTNYSNMLVNTVIAAVLCGTMYCYWSNHQRGNHKSPNYIISQYVDSFRKYKLLSKVMLSYLRDCQIARTPYATGVTWSKLDNIEQQCSEGLQSATMRRKLFDSLRSVFVEQKKTIEGWLETSPLISEIDCVNRYICLQDHLEILSENEMISSDMEFSSHTLRYHLKLVEHMSSEVLWRFSVSTFPGSWPEVRLNNKQVNSMLTVLHSLQEMVSARCSELRRFYEKHNNPGIENAVLAPAEVLGETSASHLSHQLRLLHSSLNIATIRCRDAQSLLSQEGVTDLVSTLSLIKLNVDLADATLQTLSSLTKSSAPTHAPLQRAETDQTLEEGEGRESIPIIPYKQLGNMVFTAVNDGTDSAGLDVGGLDSDDELELNMHRHKQESKLMLAELKHVIDNNPTCLYEDDYQEFKQTGLLNPTKLDLKEMYENRSEDGSDTELPEHSEQTPLKIGFNPMSLPFPSHPFSGASYPFPGASSLFREMEVCEAYGDLSEEEDEEGNTEEGGDLERKKVLTGKAIAKIDEEINENEVIDAREEEERTTVVNCKRQENI